METNRKELEKTNPSRAGWSLDSEKYTWEIELKVDEIGRRAQVELSDRGKELMREMKKMR